MLSIRPTAGADWKLRLFGEVTAVLKLIRGWRSQGCCLQWWRRTFKCPTRESGCPHLLTILPLLELLFLSCPSFPSYLSPPSPFPLHTMFCSVFSQASCCLLRTKHLTHLWTFCVEQRLGQSRCSTNITSLFLLPAPCQGLPVISQAWMWVTSVMSHQPSWLRGWEVIVGCLPKFSEG